MPPPTLVDDPAALDRALALLRDAPVIGLDTETDAFFAYRPRICLLQLTVPDEDLLIDPLADLDLSALGELLGDPGHQVVLHASENDVIFLQHQFGWRIADLYDTQAACFVLGLAPYSLAGILEARFGVKLDKRQQRSDWSQRPLTDAQVEYAAEDTHYLLDLAADVQQRVADAGRDEEVSAECRRIAAREWEPEPFDEDGFHRMSGARELDATALRVLRELYLFRHHEADRRNRAPYRIVGDAALVALAGAHPGAKEPPRGVPPAFWRRYGSQLRTRMDRARKQGPLPPRPRKRGPRGERLTAKEKRRYECLRQWRTQAAEERGVESFVVARNELLLKVATADVVTLQDLAQIVEPFRAREYGAAMLAAMLDSGDNAPT